MARGWESKSVEAQIQESESEIPGSPEHKVSPEELQTLFRRKELALSRKHVLRQLEDSSDERYAELLRRTLAGLDAEIATLS